VCKGHKQSKLKIIVDYSFVIVIIDVKEYKVYLQRKSKSYSGLQTMQEWFVNLFIAFYRLKKMKAASQ